MLSLVLLRSVKTGRYDSIEYLLRFLASKSNEEGNLCDFINWIMFWSGNCMREKTNHERNFLGLLQSFSLARSLLCKSGQIWHWQIARSSFSQQIKCYASVCLSYFYKYSAVKLESCQLMWLENWKGFVRCCWWNIYVKITVSSSGFVPKIIVYPNNHQQSINMSTILESKMRENVATMKKPIINYDVTIIDAIPQIRNSFCHLLCEKLMFWQNIGHQNGTVTINR